MKKNLLKISILILCFLCINVKAAACPNGKYNVFEDSKTIYCCPLKDDKVSAGKCYITTSVKTINRSGSWDTCEDTTNFKVMTIDQKKYCVKEDGDVVTVNKTTNVCGAGFVSKKTENGKSYCCKSNEELFGSTGNYSCGSIITTSSVYTRDGSSYCSPTGTLKDGKCYMLGFSAKVVDSSGKEVEKRTEKEVTTLTGSKVDVVDCEDGQTKWSTNTGYVCCDDGQSYDSNSQKCVSKETGEESYAYVATKTKELGKAKELSVKYSKFDFCKLKTSIDVMRIIGIAVALIKLLIPVILVITTTISLGKAMILEDNTDMKKYVHMFITKFIVSVGIFFLPTIMIFIFDMAKEGFTNLENYEDCVECALDYNSCPTTGLKCIYTCKGDSCEEKDYNTGTSTDYIGDCTTADSGVDEDGTCSLLGDPTNSNNIAYYLQLSLTVMKWAGLILAIIMSIYDVFKFVFGDNKDGGKVIVGNIIKRLSYACILLFLPTLIELLFTMLGLYGTCNIL